MDYRDPLSLIHLQLELEGIGTDCENLLFRLPGDWSNDIGYFLVVRHAEGYATYIHHLSDPTVVAELRTLPPELAFDTAETLLRRLYGDTPDLRACYFSTYYFARLALPAEYLDVHERAGEFVVFAGSVVVSRAWSPRANSRAAEVSVETKPDFRRRGYARQACLAWAAYHLERGRVALYCHNRDNLASRALAISLGVVHFMDGVWCYG
jgi:RimJ/RimL family protein N-acetyltransferase